jgi:hypothetical protein
VRSSDPTESFWPAARRRQWGEIGLYTAGVCAGLLMIAWSWQSGGGGLGWVNGALVVALSLPGWVASMVGLVRGIGVRLDMSGVQVRRLWGVEYTPWTNIEWVGHHRDPPYPPDSPLAGVLVVYCKSADEVSRSWPVRLRLRYWPVPGPFVIWIRPGVAADSVGLEARMRERLGLHDEDFDKVFAPEPFDPDDWFPPEFVAKRRRRGFAVSEVDACVARLEEKVRRSPNEVGPDDFRADFPRVRFQKSYNIDHVMFWLDDVEFELTAE